jgi:protein translocase SecG subunit
MGNFLTYTQLVISVLLIVSVLLQNRGSGLSAAFGGDFGGFHTKRGIEKFLFISSVILGTLFVVNALATIIISAKG